MKKLSRQYEYEPYTMPLHFMDVTSVSEAVRQEYLSRHYESSTLHRYEDLLKSRDVYTVAYEDLPKRHIDGFPIGSHRDSTGKLQFIFAKGTPNTHTLTIGTTGSGKTTGYVEPGLRAISSKKNRPSLFITDPKGELLQRHAGYLKDRGYKLYVVNFKDIIHSDCWNPLVAIYDLYIKQKDLRKTITYMHGLDKLSDYKVKGKKEDFFDSFWVFGNCAYPTEPEAIRACELKSAEIISFADALIPPIVNELIPEDLIGTHDPSWMNGARGILSGIIHAMLEDALDERTGFTKDMMNLMTIQSYYDCIRTEVVGKNKPILETKKLSHKTTQDVSIRELRTFFENAPTTIRSYLGCFRNAMQKWFNFKIFTICNGNTVDIEHDTDQPFAIFLITRDYERTDFTIAGVFIEWVYSVMLERADDHCGRLSDEMYFMLDEFANIPKIVDFDTKISTSRSRNIWFYMFIQSYSQLDRIYGADAARTIMTNCNNHVFVGSQDYETKSRFARECGKQTIQSYDSVMNPANKSLSELPLLNIRQLDSLKPGQMYMKHKDMPLLLTEFVRSYECEEFREDRLITPEKLGFEAPPFNAEKYRYAFLESDKDMREYIKTRGEAKDKQSFYPDFLYEVI